MLVWVLPLQALLMSVDEFYCHYRRGLPRWERLGHPLDTFSVGAPLLLCLLVPPSDGARWLYWILVGISCLLVTKDEWVHAGRCGAFEHWLHALLFLIHPLTFLVIFDLWRSWWVKPGVPWLGVQAVFVCAFGIYQLWFWNLRKRHAWKR